MIIGKTVESSNEYEELIFVRRDINNLTIPTFINPIKQTRIISLFQTRC